MKQVLCFVLFLVPSVWGAPRSFRNDYTKGDPDIYRNVSELISSKGYPVEDHWVTTEDGYILSVQHIPHGRAGGPWNNQKVVLLVHGLFGTADNYVFNFPNQSLGFILADKGYDVWLVNVRGTTYSRGHVKYSNLQTEFWNFSFDEMATYDLPAVIDYVLKITGRPNLSYVGHSQGTLVAFALLSEKPEYNEKINLFAALAPVAYLGNMPFGVNRFLCYILNDAGSFLGNHEMFGNNSFLLYVKELFCDSFAVPVCRGFFFELFGDDKQLNKTRLPVYAGHFPDSTSTKNLVHFGQLVESSKFRKYDYGKKGNMAHYNQSSPPEWDVSRISTPVALLWSDADDMANPTDVNILRHKLTSLVGDYQVPFDGFLHVDFVLAMQADTLVYEYLLGLLQKV